MNQLIYQHIRYNARQLYFSYGKIFHLIQDYQLLLWLLLINPRHQYQNPQVQLTQEEEYVLNQRCLGRWKAKNEDDLRNQIFDFSGFPVETINYEVKK